MLQMWKAISYFKKYGWHNGGELESAAIMDVSELDSLKSENQKLRSYISLVNAEIELSQRLYEIKQNFSNSPDSERITVPILDRISKIKSEKDVLENELKLMK